MKKASRLLSLLLVLAMIAGLILPVAKTEAQEVKELIVSWDFNSTPSKQSTVKESPAVYSAVLSFGGETWAAINADNVGDTWNGDGSKLVSVRSDDDTATNCIISPAFTIPEGAGEVSFELSGVYQGFEVYLAVLNGFEKNTDLLPYFTETGYPLGPFSLERLYASGETDSTGNPQTYYAKIDEEYAGLDLCLIFGHQPYCYGYGTTLTLDNVTVSSVKTVATKYYVTFSVPEGADCDVTTVTTDPNGRIGSLPTASRPGFEFVGWTRNDVLIDKNTVFTSDCTVYAKWNKIRSGKTYTVTVDSPYPKGITDETGANITRAEAGEWVTVHTDGGYNEDGKLFRGWEVVSGDVRFENSSDPEATFLMPAENVTLRPVYDTKPMTYTITLEVGEGSVNGTWSAKLKTDENGRVRNIPVAISDEGLEFLGWFNEEYGFLSEEIIFNKDARFFANFRDTIGEDGRYAYWAETIAYGYSFRYRDNLDLSTKSYVMVLLKDKDYMVTDPNDPNIIASYPVTENESSTDFSDDIIIHGSGTYYARLYQQYRSGGKQCLAGRSDSYPTVYREKDWFYIADASVNAGDHIELDAKELFTLTFDAALPAWMAEGGWSVQPTMALRKMDINGVLGSYDYAAFEPISTKYTSCKKIFGFKSAGTYEIRFGFNLVRNGGRVVSMSENKIGTAVRTFNVVVKDKNPSAGGKALKSLSIGEYTFSDWDLSFGSKVSDPNGHWTAEITESGSEAKFTLLTIQLNNYNGGAIIAEHTDKTHPLYVRITANGTNFITAKSSLHSDGDYPGAITLLSTGTELVTVLTLNGKLTLKGMKGIRMGVPSDNTTVEYDADPSLYIRGDGTLDILADSVGIQNKAPFTHGKKKYTAGNVRLEDTAKVNIRIANNSGKACGIDMGHPVMVGVQIRERSALCITVKDGTAFTKNTFAREISIEDTANRYQYWGVWNNLYLSIPNELLELSLDRDEPTGDFIRTSVGNTLMFKFDIANRYIKENPCLGYYLSVDSLNPHTHDTYSCYGDTKNEKLIRGVQFNTPGLDILQFYSHVSCLYDATLIRTYSEEFFVHVDKECIHDWVLTSDTATCTQSGLRCYVCSKCEATRMDDVAALGHHVEFAWRDDGENHYQVCIRCGAHVQEGAHNWKVNKTGDTCTALFTEYKCKTCGVTKTEMTPHEAKHSYGSKYYYNSEKHWKVCTKCGAVADESAHHFKEEYYAEVCKECGYTVYSGNSQYLTCNVHYLCPHVTATIDTSHLSAQNRTNVKNKTYLEMGWLDSSTWRPLDDKRTMDTLSYKPTAADINKYKSTGVTFELFFSIVELYQLDFEWALIKNITHVAEVPATCESSGVKEHYICTCGQAIDKNYNIIEDLTVPALGHIYDNDCDETCNRCGAVREAKHDFDTAWTTEDGAHYHVCKRCGAITAYAPCTAGDWIVDKPATCTETGHRYCECSVCGTLMNEETVEMTHNFSAWTAVEAADCTHGGKMVRVCLTCGAEEAVAVPALGHRIEANDGTVATCIAEGLASHYACSRCGKYFTDTTGVQELTEPPILTGKNFGNHVGGPLEHDKDAHWIHCACGNDIQKGDHSFNSSGVCTVCGYINPKSPAAHASNPLIHRTGNVLLDFWWLWLLILLLLLLLAILLYKLTKDKKSAPDPDKTDADPVFTEAELEKAEPNEAPAEAPKTE